MTVPTITDDLVAELEAKSNRGHPEDYVTIKRIDLATLLAERAELKRDAERFSWLIGQDNCVVQEGTNGFWLQWIDEHDHRASVFQDGSHRTYREAIDKAMQEQPK